MPYARKEDKAKQMREWRKKQREREMLLRRRLKEIDKDFHNKLFPPKKRRKKK